MEDYFYLKHQRFSASSKCRKFRVNFLAHVLCNFGPLGIGEVKNQFFQAIHSSVIKTKSFNKVFAIIDNIKYFRTKTFISNILKSKS